MPKAQRVRDPVHNLIEFDTGEFEQACWKAFQTRPMQRLRRVKQLGFSEFTYPGATHSRLAHSVGVFHTARMLAGIIRRRVGDDRYDNQEAQVAVAAALVHDVGHGPFSHAFEDALKKIGVAKKHEMRTRDILAGAEFAAAFEEFPSYLEKITQLIESEFPRNIYASIVSSQFDADRLDYMRRDRMMSGTQQSGIDFDWLMANLDVGKVVIDQDGKIVRRADTLVIHEKALIAAEGYIFSLLYLYINVYFHKTTRGLEKLFTALIARVAMLLRDGSSDRVSLPDYHPLVKFLNSPDDIEAFLNLDDTAVLGSLSMLTESADPAVAELARRIRDRSVYVCVDVSRVLGARFGLPRPGDTAGGERERAHEVNKRVAKVGEMINESGLLEKTDGDLPVVLEDTAPRSPYKRATSTRLFSKIHVIAADGELHDLAEMSPAVNSLSDYRAYRIYARGDSELQAINAIIGEASQ